MCITGFRVQGSCRNILLLSSKPADCDSVTRLSTQVKQDFSPQRRLVLMCTQVIQFLKACTTLAALQAVALGVRPMCAAIRASLETHIRAEEAELWPLFSEHFSTEEQQYLVGVIIGRTGATVLQALLPWITGVVTGYAVVDHGASCPGMTKQMIY